MATVAAPLQIWAPMSSEDARLTTVRPFTEGASQTFTTLDLVTLSGGKVVIAKAAGNNMTSGDTILGRPTSDASGTTDNPLNVEVFLAGHTDRMPVYNATAASAVTAITDIGTAYGLRNDVTQGWCINNGDTSATKVRIIGISGDYPVGTQYGLEDATYLSASLLGAGA